MVGRRRFIQGFFVMLAAVMPRRALADDLDNGTFRKEVLAVLRKYRPDIVPELPDDPMIIIFGKARVSLGNLWADIKDATGTERDDAIKVYIDFGIALMADKKAPDWAQAKDLLRIQIVPIEYRAQAPFIITKDLARRVVIAYAIDTDNSYNLVTELNLKDWKIDLERVHSAAITGLDRASAGVEIKVITNDTSSGKLVAVITGDSYDAARLLVPGFMSRLHSLMGEKFFVGIPSRDTFVAWSPEFARSSGLYAKISQDAETLPHPLTEELFVADADGVRLATADETAAHIKQP